MASNADVTNTASQWKEQLKDIIVPDFDAEDVRTELGYGLYGEACVVAQNGVSYLAKKFHVSVFSKDEFRSSFTQDCLLMSRLCHPRVVQLLGVQIEDSFSSPPVIVSELYPLSLSSCLQTYPEMPIRSKYTILLETAVGIGYLHGLSPPVVHGHLTPNNILLTEGLHVKIADCARFGLNIAPPSNSPYQAPEEVRGAPGDVFSLGDIMLHVALQREPNPLQYKHHRNLENKNEPVILTEIKRREIFLGEVDDANVLKGLILQCLDEEPSQRPTPKTVEQELNLIVEDHKPEYNNILEMFVALGQLSLMKENVSSHEETVKAKEEEIEALKEQMEPLTEEISAKEAVITAVKEELEGYKQALQSKEGRIKAHETGVRAKEALIKAKDREIAAKKQVLVSKEALLRSANKRIATLEQHVKVSRKKGSVALPLPPPSPVSLPDARFLSEPMTSPENVMSSSGGALRSPQPYRGTSSSPLHDAQMQRLANSRAAPKVADPQLAVILARQQKRINDNMDCIHETKDEVQRASAPSLKPRLRKRSNTADVPASSDLKMILQKRKSLVEDSI